MSPLFVYLKTTISGQEHTRLCPLMVIIYTIGMFAKLPLSEK